MKCLRDKTLEINKIKHSHVKKIKMLKMV